MSLPAFLRDNLRWLAGGFLLTFFSSFGQTFFISLSAGDIRAEYGLSHGEFGTLYMGATLGSAFTIAWLGRMLDRFGVVSVVLQVIPALAVATLAMAMAQRWWQLFAAIYFLRLMGQGMMTQTAFTVTGRWFAANRGRAMSIVTLGHNAGEGVFPFLFVAAAQAFGWRGAWATAGVILIFIALPAIAALVRVDRAPENRETARQATGGRDWTRSEVMTDPLFWLMLTGVLAPPFIGTTVFFHQVYLVELRGWSLEQFAASFIVMSMMTILFALVCGALVDRFSARAVLPSFLLPLAAACFTLASFTGIWSAFAFMALMGISYGFSSTLFGALWPEVYGVRHLGSVRSVIVAFMVFSTAMGPGITGFLIDRGISYPAQIAAMGVYCLIAALVLLMVSRRLLQRDGIASPRAPS